MQRLRQLRTAATLNPAVDSCLDMRVQDLDEEERTRCGKWECPLTLKRADRQMAVEIDDKRVELQLELRVECQLSTEEDPKIPNYQVLVAVLRFPPDYQSAFSDAVDRQIANALIATHQTYGRYAGSTMLMEFYSTRQKPQFFKLQSAGERAALRGIAARMLCETLGYGVQIGAFPIDQRMTLEASGVIAGGERSGLIRYYESLGFEKIIDGDIGGGDWAMESNVRNILQHCARAAGERSGRQQKAAKK